jgi:hypothetical protein
MTFKETVYATTPCGLITHGSYIDINDKQHEHVKCCNECQIALSEMSEPLKTIWNIVLGKDDT